MSNETLNITVVTPTGIALEKDILFVKLPGVLGEIGVLPSHSATLSTLKSGKIRVKDTNGEVDKFFIPHGFTEVLEEKLTVYVPYLESANSIDIDRTKTAKNRAEERLKTDNPEIDKTRAKKALERAEARIEIYNLHHNIK